MQGKPGIKHSYIAIRCFNSVGIDNSVAFGERDGLLIYW